MSSSRGCGAATCHGEARSAKPEAETDNQRTMAAAHAAAEICRPSRAFPMLDLGIPGADAPGYESDAPSGLSRAPMSWSHGRGAAERRQIFSLGREPQDQVREKTTSREAATDNRWSVAAAHAAAIICRPFRAFVQRTLRTLGLTPQAMNLTPLRGFPTPLLVETGSPFRSAAGESQ